MTYGDLEKETYETLYPLYMRAQRCFASLGCEYGPRHVTHGDLVVYLMMLTNTDWRYDVSSLSLSKVFRLEASSLEELDLRLTLEGY